MGSLELKILDFTTLLPGPFATMMLADMGADVVRVEAPGRWDMVRSRPPFDDGVAVAIAPAPAPVEGLVGRSGGAGGGHRADRNS